jgi:ATP synthase protein I
MDEFAARLKAVTRTSFLFLSACFLGWALFPAYKEIFAGLVIGAAASLINALHLAWKINRIGDAAARQTKRRPTLGYLTRACIGLLAVIISTRTFHFDLVSTIAGLFLAPLATLLLGVAANARKGNRHPARERGDKKHGPSETNDSP